MDKEKARIGDLTKTIADDIVAYNLSDFKFQTPKCFQTVIESSKLRFLAWPSTDKSFKMTIRIYHIKILWKIITEYRAPDQ